MRLADLSWPEIGQRAAAGAVLAVPVGSTEQHGPHLPLSTDTDIAVALCDRLAAARPDVLVAPPVGYGSSGEHAAFPGTLSIGQGALELLLVELGRSATLTFGRLVLVSAHGGNAAPVARAAAQLGEESRRVLLFQPCWDGDPHAGHPETSMMLQLDPARVHMDRAVPGDTRPLGQTWPQLRTAGVRAVSATGILGDPTGATAEAGRALLDTLAADLIRDVTAWVRVPARGTTPGTPDRRSARPIMSRVAVVTGAGRGIGAATVLALAEAGWSVLATDSAADDPALPYPMATPDDLSGLAAEAGRRAGAPDQVRPFIADVRDPAAVDAAVAEAESRWGGLDAAIAAAGVIAGGVPLWQLPAGQQQAVLDVNLGGVLTLARAAIPRCSAARRRGPGGSWPWPRPRPPAGCPCWPPTARPRRRWPG